MIRFLEASPSAYRRSCGAVLCRDQQARSSEAGEEAPGNASNAEPLVQAAKKAEWRGLHEVRREYPSADQVGDVLIFDVLGNNDRLMTRVEYNRQRIYVKALLNHREYDRKEWMKWA
jgi:mRNA interferase HigB